MADLTRAEELVQTIGRDAEFQAAIQAAPTATVKREVLDARGYQDVNLDDMRAYVESKGGTLTFQQGGRELSEQELAAVAGGLTDEEIGIATGVAVGGVALGAGITIAAFAAA